MAHIAIVGAGIGGVTMALEMREAVGRDHDVTVISNRDSFQFTPSNPWVAVNWRKRSQVEVPLAPVLERKGINFTSVGAKRIDPASNSIVLDDGHVIRYDYAALSTGPDLAFDEIEGFGPEGYTHSVCNTEHAEAMGQAYEEFVKDPGPIVLGGVQGTSCFGPAYELAMIIETDLRRRGIRHLVPITIVTAEPYIGHLGLAGVGDTKGLLEAALRHRDIRWITNARVHHFERDKVCVEVCDDEGQPKKQLEVASKLTMMIPAFRGVKALHGIQGLVNPRGMINVDRYQRNPTYQNVFGVGVAIAIKPNDPTPLPTGVPKTGYMIETMATAAVQNIGELVRGRAVRHEATCSALCLADWGGKGSFFVAIPQIPPRNTCWHASGRWVHWAKIGFEKYFLTKVKLGLSEPLVERYALKSLGLSRLVGQPATASGRFEGSPVTPVVSAAKD